MPKRLDRFFVGEVGNVLGQLEFRLIVALAHGKGSSGEVDARILDQRQNMRTDRGCFARHELTSMNYCSRLIQPAIIMDKSVIGKP
ncbi:hypothetical protein [Paracoccus thiocyanatus]|uniref:hypothetical protein n=1 Tax=Paracoccus thiocyanatus TaxID=34006 RepID=UPI00122C35A6|nr:hypothetical protein [Paracoccus thiocyanatus]